MQGARRLSAHTLDVIVCQHISLTVILEMGARNIISRDTDLTSASRDIAGQWTVLMGKNGLNRVCTYWIIAVFLGLVCITACRHSACLSVNISTLDDINVALSTIVYN